MGELLALASALSFGLTHFVAGLAARRAPGVTVALYAQLCGTALSLAVAVAAEGSPDGPAAGLGWGVVSGLGTGIGVAFLYRALARGAMSVVVPVSDVTAVALPVVVGIALLGERPAALALGGIAAAVPALWLVSRGRDAGSGAHGRPGRGRTPALADALVAGVGFAVHFLAVARIPEGGELWAVAVSRAVSVAVVAVPLLCDGEPWRLRPRLLPHVAAAGAVGTLATVLYLYATRHELMAVAAVLASLYPAVPVLLALVLLRERLTLRQTAGLLCAGTAIGLIAMA